MYINSPGGVVTSGLAIYDTMQYIRCPVSTTCMGMAASMGSFLLMAGEPGLRVALPNARIMVHQPSGGFQGKASDIERHAEDILKTKRRLNELYAKHYRPHLRGGRTHPRPRPLHGRRGSQGLGHRRPHLRIPRRQRSAAMARPDARHGRHARLWLSKKRAMDYASARVQAASAPAPRPHPAAGDVNPLEVRRAGGRTSANRPVGSSWKCRTARAPA